MAKKRLTVFHDDNSSFSDYSYESFDFGRDTFTIDLNQSEDYLYVGLEKPFQQFYVELSTANTNAGSFTGEYYNDSASSWTSLTGFVDDTKSFTRSGFLTWDISQEDWGKTTINSEELFWVRFRPSVTHSSTVATGLSPLFANDQDLKEEFFEISSYVPSGESSFVLVHQAVKNKIIQLVRNSYSKVNQSASRTIPDEFDLLDREEVRQAAKYMALEKIFMNISDAPDDKYADLQSQYKQLSDQAFNTLRLTLDLDDDGIVDSNEKLRINVTRIETV